MQKNSILLSFLILIGGFLFSINYISPTDAQAPSYSPSPAEIEKYTNEYFAKICYGHGGINCSAVNSDASIVCNDGTIDQSLATIYAVPQCQETLNRLAGEQSDFMAETGCYPASEMGCYSENSYKSLLGILTASGLASSELGKQELAQCRRQIDEHTRDNTIYKECLIKNGQPQFQPSGKIVLPILKTAFCPAFYGQNASYDFDSDLCLCDRGYFMYNEQCTLANTICQNKYGSMAYSKDGNCVVNSPISIPLVSTTPKPTTYLKPVQAQPQITEYVVPENYEIDHYEPKPFNNNGVEPKTSEPSFIGKIISSIVSSIKKIFTLN